MDSELALRYASELDALSTHLVELGTDYALLKEEHLETLEHLQWLDAQIQHLHRAHYHGYPSPPPKSEAYCCII